MLRINLLMKAKDLRVHTYSIQPTILVYIFLVYRSVGKEKLATLLNALLYLNFAHMHVVCCYCGTLYVHHNSDCSLSSYVYTHAYNIL